jgi:hypothetical protein
LLAPIGALLPLRRATRRTTAVALLKKSVFNLRVDAMEPMLGALDPLLISGDLCFQLRDPIFGCPQLVRQILRRLKRVSAVLFRNASRSVEHLQDRLACFVESHVRAPDTASGGFKLAHSEDRYGFPAKRH